MAQYNLQFFHEHKSLYGNSIRLELLRDGFEGTPVEILNGTENPVKIDYVSKGNEDVYYPIWGSSLTFEFFEQADCKLENFVADYERDVKAVLYRNGSVIWTGWVIPDLCQDVAYSDILKISITCTDAIGDLSNFPFLVTKDELGQLNDISDFGFYGSNIGNAQISNYENTNISLLRIIKTCLDKAELGYRIEIINDLFEVNLPTKFRRVFEYIFTDFLCYQTDGKSKTCEEVLVSILRTFNAVLMQRNGVWVIERINYVEGVVVVVDVYDNEAKFLYSKTENLRKYLKYSESNDSQLKWAVKVDSFTRGLRLPRQYQNISYDYGEGLIVSEYNKNNWTANGLTIKNGADYFEFKDDNFWFLNNLITVINNGAGSESSRRKAKNDAFNQYIKTGVFNTPIKIENDSPITISFSSSAKKLIIIVYAQNPDRPNSETGTYYYFPESPNWRAIGFINLEGYTGDLIASQIILTSDTKNSNGEYDYNLTIPIAVNGRQGYVNGYDLKIVLRGGSVTGGNEGTLVFYRNLQVTTTQQKELHAFTNINKVSYKPDDLQVLNGDGYNGGYTKSTLTYQTETATYPYVSKIIPTKLWQDSSEQGADGLLGFSARAIINNYSVRRNIVNATIISKTPIEIGKLLSFDGFSKFWFKRFLVCPQFSYNTYSDEYNLKLFELSCDLATGRLTEYYNDNSDVPLAKSVTDYTGSTCVMTFSVESVCVDDNRIFTVTSICDGMANYLSVINENSTQYSNYYWSFLSGFNRLAVEVTDWAKPILSIPNTGSFGLKVQSPGDYTVFRKNKQNGLVDYVNITANDCSVISTQVLFTTVAGDASTGFNFKRIVTITELAGNQLTQFQYGYTLIETDEITNWQTSPEFNLINEGVYYFDVKVTGKTGTVGKQSVELYLQDVTNITGAEESDNPIFGNNSSED